MSERITRKEYEESGSDCLVNSTAYSVWRAARMHEAGVSHYLALFGDNKAKFKETFGKQSVCWDGYERNWIWKIPLPHGYLYAGVSTRGTTYEVVASRFPCSHDAFETACTEAMNLLQELFKEELK